VNGIIWGRGGTQVTSVQPESKTANPPSQIALACNTRSRQL
jgi:hypothetical protein